MTDPVWAHEHVVIAEPDPAWSARAAAERAELLPLLAPWLTHGIEHVGSTSVPGLAAKPILDLMAGVADPAACDGAIAVLAAAGWHHVPPALDGQPWRRFYVKAREGRRYAHLHLVTGGGPPWGMMRTFRDRLRADPALLSEYAALKRSLAESLGADRERYTAAKADFILAALG